jgi:hypothetical protein
MTSTPDYVLIGHITADLMPDGTHLPGGTASYAAPVAKTFGHRAALLTSAACDETLLRPLAAVADIALRISDVTTTFENRYTPEGRKQRVHSVADPLTPDWVPSGWLNAPLVHLAPLINEVDPALAQHFPNATIMLTPQGYLRRTDDSGQVHFKRWLNHAMLQAIDILVLSKEDIAGAPELEDEFAHAVMHCIVTGGENGGTYYHNGNAQTYEAIEVNETDPTGAGDVFAASLLASLPLLNNNFSQAVDVARRLSAQSTTQRGSGHLTEADVQQALAAARDTDTAENQP